MKSPFARVALILPLLWIFIAPSWAASGPAPKRKKTHRKTTSIETYQGVDFSQPVATLGTPEKSVEVFRLTRHESPDWSYMIVRVEDGQTRLGYADEHTVGGLLETLSRQFKDTPAGMSRCPAAASGWRYERGTFHVSYCSESPATERIERAVTLLETTPSLE